MQKRGGNEKDPEKIERDFPVMRQLLGLMHFTKSGDTLTHMGRAIPMTSADIETWEFVRDGWGDLDSTVYEKEKKEFLKNIDERLSKEPKISSPLSFNSDSTNKNSKDKNQKNLHSPSPPADHLYSSNKENSSLKFEPKKSTLETSSLKYNKSKNKTFKKPRLSHENLP